MTARRGRPDDWLSRPVARGLLVLAALLLAVVGGWLWFNRTSDAISDLNRQLQQFRAAGSVGDTLIELSGVEAVDAARELPGFRLPAGAANVHFARQGRAHALYWLRFTVSPDDSDVFLRSTCLAGRVDQRDSPVFEYTSSADVIARLDWWTPRHAYRSSGGSCKPAPDVVFRAVVDTVADARNVYFEISTGVTA